MHVHGSFAVRPNLKVRIDIRIPRFPPLFRAHSSLAPVDLSIGPCPSTTLSTLIQIPSTYGVLPGLELKFTTEPHLSKPLTLAQG
jgi:hypothetical protein